MMEFFGILVLLGIGLPVLGIAIVVGLYLDYSAKKRGLTKGASQRELEQIRQDIVAIRREIEAIRESQADMTLMLHDLPQAMLPKEGSPSGERK